MKAVTLVCVVVLMLATVGCRESEPEQTAREYMTLTGQPVPSGWFDRDYFTPNDHREAIEKAKEGIAANNLRLRSNQVVVKNPKIKDGRISFEKKSVSGLSAILDYDLGFDMPSHVPPPAVNLILQDSSGVGGSTTVAMPGKGLVAGIALPHSVLTDRIYIHGPKGTVVVKQLTLFVAP